MKAIDEVAEDLAFFTKAGKQWIVEDFSKVHRTFVVKDPNNREQVMPFDHVANPENGYNLYAVSPIKVRAPFRPMAQLSFKF